MSSKRRLRRNACSGKIRFESEAAARAGIRSMFLRKGFVGHMTPYRCQFCGAFHYGHPPRRVREALYG